MGILTDNNSGNMDQQLQDDTNSEKDTEQEPSEIEEITLNNVDIEAIKVSVGAAASRIISNPDHNMSLLKELLKLMDVQFEHLVLYKLIALTAMEIFKDIIPEYRISEKIHEEESSANTPRLKRETLKLRNFERTLCQLYKFYLQRLERMVECPKRSASSNFFQNGHLSMDAKVDIAAVGSKCMGELLVSRPGFNFRDQLVKKLVEFNAQAKHQLISEISHHYLSLLLRQDKLGEVSYEVVNVVSEISKARKTSLSPLLFRTLLNLRLINVRDITKEIKEKKDKAKKKRETMEKLSRRERKRNKKMGRLKRELLESEAHITTDQKLKYHTNILRKLFLTYFRLIRYHEDMNDSERHAFQKVIQPVLEGLAKFSNLIDIKLCEDIFPSLHSILKERRLSSQNLLHCLKTVFVMMKTLGSVMQVDPHSFYQVFYSMLTELEAHNMTLEELESLNECIAMMLTRRARQLSHQRAASFIRRLLTFSVDTQPPAEAVRLLESTRKLMVQHPSATALLDTSNCANFGAGVYDPELDDPDHNHAESSVAWELHILSKHYDTRVRQAASSIMSLATA